MELALTIFAGILLGIGFLGTFVPILPGAPLAWAGLLLAYFSDYNEISLTILITATLAAPPSAILTVTVLGP